MTVTVIETQRSNTGKSYRRWRLCDERGTVYGREYAKLDDALYAAARQQQAWDLWRIAAGYLAASRRSRR